MDHILDIMDVILLRFWILKYFSEFVDYFVLVGRRGYTQTINLFHLNCPISRTQAVCKTRNFTHAFFQVLTPFQNLPAFDHSPEPLCRLFFVCILLKLINVHLWECCTVGASIILLEAETPGGMLLKPQIIPRNGVEMCGWEGSKRIYVIIISIMWESLQRW